MYLDGFPGFACQEEAPRSHLAKMMVRSLKEEEVGLLQQSLATTKGGEKPKPQKVLESLPSQQHIQKEHSKTSWRNLPQKSQLLLLALCRLSTPLSNACLLPYIYPLVSSILTTLNPDDSAPQNITRLTGLLIASYPLGQATTSLLWTRLSITYGRKPIILASLLLSILANLGFAFSTSIASLLFWRVLAGMANGVVGVMRTMTTEIVREKRWNARAFLAMPVVFNGGRVAGVVLGGVLAGVGGRMGWKKWPYALPAVFNAVVLTVCLITAVLGLRETLEAKREKRDWGIELRTGVYSFFSRRILRKPGERDYVFVENAVDDGNQDEVEKEGNHSTTTSTTSLEDPPYPGSIFNALLLRALISFPLLHLHNTTFLHIFPVFLSMPIQDTSSQNIFHTTSGLSLSPPKIGLSLGIIGMLGMVLQLFLYPRLQKQIGTHGVLRFANILFPVAYTLAPFLALLARAAPIAKYTAISAVLFLQVMARTMAMPSNIVLLTNAAKQRKAVGNIQGVGHMLASFASAVGPIVGGWVLSRGIEMGFGGLVWWCWMGSVAALALGCSFVGTWKEDK